MNRVREGRAADVPRLRAVQSAALAEPWPELLAAAPDGPADLLVVEADRPVGYALVLADAAVAYVPEFAVHPDRQGEGHGSRLMTTLCDRLATRGHEVVRLTVRAEDDRARAFYEGHGFERVERLPDHFEGGDGLVLVRRLAPDRRGGG